MNKPLLARDLMVKKLVTLTPEMDVHEAIGVLLKHKISGAPVIDGHRNFVGVFSEKSCMRVVIEAAYDGLPSNTVESFMDTQCRTITEDTDLLTIAQIFADTPFRRLPVLDGATLVGQISRRDVLRSTHRMLQVPKPSESGLLYLSALVERHESPIG